MQIILATLSHIDQIIALNRKYLITQLSNNEQLQNGFVRIAYNREELQLIIANKEIVIAVDNEMIVGYYLIGRKSGSPALAYQRNFALTINEGMAINTIGYGCQVCIDESYRNNGLFAQMLQILVSQVKVKYNYLLCSVSNANLASLNTHLNNGWKTMGTIENTNYLLLTTHHQIIE